MLNHTEIGTGTPVVMIHGWAQQGAVFSPLVRQLPEYRLLLPDLPGHGKSNPLDDATLTGWTESLRRWFLTACDCPFHLVGWSLGATLLLQLLSSDSMDLPIESLTLIGATACFVEDKRRPGMPLKQLRLLKSGLRRHPSEALAAFDRLMMAESYDGEAFVSAGGNPESLLQGLEILQQTDLTAVLPQIDLPVLQLHGIEDRIVPIAAAQQMKPLLRAQFCRFDSGHAPFIEQPELCAKQLKAFWHG